MASIEFINNFETDCRSDFKLDSIMDLVINFVLFLFTV